MFFSAFGDYFFVIGQQLTRHNQTEKYYLIRLKKLLFPKSSVHSVQFAVDSEYIKLRHNILNSTETSVYAKQLRSVFSHFHIDDDLLYINAKQMVLPIAAVKDILQLAHATHSGITKTFELYQSSYFWQGMFNNIKQMISSCRPCSLNASSLPKNPRSTLLPSAHLGPPHGSCWRGPCAAS